MTQQMQQKSSGSGAGAVVATVGCSVLGMMLAGPVGAVIGGGLAIAATAGSGVAAQPAQRSQLSISSISMPQDGIIRQDGVTYFAMDVVDTTGSTWRVLRRYNQFDRFRKVLRSKGLRTAFPGKLWFGCEGHRLVERRRRLEAWTRDVVRSYAAGVPGRLEFELNDFFTRGRGQVTPLHAAPTAYPEGSFPIEVPAGVVAGQQLTAKNPMDGSSFNIVVPEGMGPGSILQVQPPPAATSEAVADVHPDASVCPTPKSSFRAASEPQRTLLSISVPPGVLPGQTLAVKVPDGRELTVVVPNGAGQELQLELDAASGMLTLLDETLGNASEPHKSQTSRSESDDLFQIYVPSGVRPGQMVNIQVPDGRQLPFTVPAGKRPGDELLLCLDATRSRLLQA